MNLPGIIVDGYSLSLAKLSRGRGCGFSKLITDDEADEALHVDARCCTEDAPRLEVIASGGEEFLDGIWPLAVAIGSGGSN